MPGAISTSKREISWKLITGFLVPWEDRIGIAISNCCIAIVMIRKQRLMPNIALKFPGAYAGGSESDDSFRGRAATVFVKDIGVNLSDRVAPAARLQNRT